MTATNLKLMKPEDYLLTLSGHSLEERYALFRRARGAFGNIVTGCGWTTFETVIEKFADEPVDLIRLVLLQLREIEYLFDDDLLEDDDWELPGDESPDSSKLWNGDVRKVVSGLS